MRTPASSSGDSLDRESLGHELDLWVRDGLITASEAEAIRAFEASPEAGAAAVIGPTLPAPARRVPLVTEVLGYVGAVAVVAASMNTTSQAECSPGCLTRCTIAMITVITKTGTMKK